MIKRFVIRWHVLGANYHLHLVADNPIETSDWEPNINEASEYETVEEAEAALKELVEKLSDDEWQFYEIIPVYRKKCSND